MGAQTERRGVACRGEGLRCRAAHRPILSCSWKNRGTMIRKWGDWPRCLFMPGPGSLQSPRSLTLRTRYRKTWAFCRLGAVPKWQPTPAWAASANRAYPQDESSGKNVHEKLI
jgi:hypothetical protein